VRTFGTVRREGANWVIDAEPHVLMRIKRVFGRANVSKSTLKLTSTPDVDRDLEWVLERYPMRMADADRAALASGSMLHRDRLERFAAVLSGAIKPRAFTNLYEWGILAESFIRLLVSEVFSTLVTPRRTITAGGR
jgi:hypothetical protein